VLHQQHGERFPKSKRLRKSPEFRRVQGRGQRIRTKSLLVLFRPAKGPSSRFGLTVSRKVGNSVIRNRVKRWLRESIRRNHQALEGSYDVVFIARRSAATAGYERIQAETIEALGQVGKAS